MKQYFFSLCLLCACLFSFAQKKPLDHSVYDGWQSIGERMISNDGKLVVYAVNPQEGDWVLVIQSSDNRFKKEIPRGYNARITEDSRFVICKIKPFFKDTREAKIKKKKPEELPKDSLAIFEWGKDSVIKIPGIKSYKTPEKGSGWLAYLSEKGFPEIPKTKTQPDSLTQLNNLSRVADSLVRVADSLRNKAAEAKTKGLMVLQSSKKENKRSIADPVEEGTQLVLRNLQTGAEQQYKLVKDYVFSKKGNRMVMETTRKNSDTLSKGMVLWLSLTDHKVDTVMKGINDGKNYAMDEDGSQLAFVAERDSVQKALKKFYKLWYYKPGMDSAALSADKNTTGVSAGLNISENYILNFSKDGKRLFLGLAPIRQPKDTTLVDFETARLDVWNYNDDYLPPQQLVLLNNELKRSYTAVMNSGDHTVLPLADENCETVTTSDEGNGIYALGRTTKGYRIQQQWEQSGLEKLYVINTKDGSKKLVQEKVRGIAGISPKGDFIIWYDWKQRNWFTYNISSTTITNITKAIKVPMWDEEDDHPDDPPPHDLMGWQEGDKYVYVYDRYDVWKCDPTGKEAPVNFTNGVGRKNKWVYRYIPMDKEERFIRDTQLLHFTVFNEATKENGIANYKASWKNGPGYVILSPSVYRLFTKAKSGNTMIYTKESFNQSPDLYAGEIKQLPDEKNTGEGSKQLLKDSLVSVKLSAINPQQKDYNWLTVELYKWKMFNGKMSEGLLYKPENFDSTKKYPVIFYFYERDADTRYDYIIPQPVRASINIPYFVSNGYIVFDPNIYYKAGQPGEDAYNSVVSAAKALGKFKWIDTTKMAIQGHSWGGYQVAYLVTRTNMFAAAEAGAPVANMTSAYGGIRWGTGISRQFQYEKTQSRIGATLWQRPDLYIKNSPLFRADKVNTPLLMMHNDADGAVPWYQGIEYFSALRRLGKKVWMMEYNGEDHGLLERRNRKDWSIRLGQFFDYYLKGSPEPRWMKDGVPATLKGIDWGIK